MSKKSPPDTSPPTPTPLPTPEQEKEPESAAVRDSRIAQLRALRGHAGTKTITAPLGPAAANINGMDTALSIAQRTQPYA